MKEQIRHMPPQRMESKEPEVNDLPGGERGPPIIAAGNRAVAFERPHIGGEGFPDQPVVLDEGVLDDLARVVIDEFAAEGISEDDERHRDNGHGQ